MNEIEDYLSEKQRLLVRMRKLLCYTASVMKIEENPDEICQNSMEADLARINTNNNNFNTKTESIFFCPKVYERY